MNRNKLKMELQDWEETFIIYKQVVVDAASASRGEAAQRLRAAVTNMTG